MKLFLTQDEKELMKIYKTDQRRLTEKEIKRVERIEHFIEIRKPFIISVIALLIAVLNLISRTIQ